MLEKVKVTINEIDELVAVIKEVWPEAFVTIIGQEQVDYMLATYQSKAQIEKEIMEGVQYFLLKKQGQTVGYTAYEIIDSKIYLSKLYLLNQVRGQGLTTAIFHWYEELAKEHGIEEIFLRVNQENALAIAVYQHQGYEIVGEMVSDIGQGFQMVDYKMKKNLA
ncbi:MAG: GNAT family N-acetyltransferase [Enterococcus lacertideformus]|uniref:GNAT family N-acetyltransferase n=1 Tax=Enterococcus lacertideformus TaxID=2771493 RepID=A0A931F902_9ENTE|nr:GNAT family N-acetyltransferase [Enterococcus lacertideformus]